MKKVQKRAEGIREVENWVGDSGVVGFKRFKDQKEACQIVS